MIEVDKFEDIEIETGAFFQKECKPAPFRVIIIPKDVIDEVNDCFKSYKDNEDEESISWVLSIIAHVKVGEKGVKVYQVNND